jgi:hypothetical protein
MGKMKAIYTDMCIEAYDCGYIAAYGGYSGNSVPDKFDQVKDYKDAYEDGYREGRRVRWVKQ